MRRRALWVCAAVLLGSCSGADGSSSPALRVLAPADYPIPQAALDVMEARHGIEVVVLRSPVAEDMVADLNVAVESPVADLALGLDELALAGLERHSELVAHESRVEVPTRLTGELGNRATPLSYRDRCFVVDAAALRSRELPVPGNLLELLDDQLTGEVVVPPAGIDRDGTVFLLALVAEFGEISARPWDQYLRNLIDHGLVITEPGEDPFFDVAASPTRPEGPAISWDSATLPAVAAGAQPELPAESDLEVIEAGCIRLVETAVIPVNSDDPEVAGDLIEAMLGKDSQRALIDSYGRMPVLQGLGLPAHYRAFWDRPVAPGRIQPSRIRANLTRWLELWSTAAEGTPSPREPE